MVSPALPSMVDYVVGAERLGATSVWVPEFWAHDALTPLGVLAQATETMRLGTAIVQVGTRTPAMLAMSAMTLQELSGGRFILGIGTSGPQVMEGWHGVRFAQPVARTQETIEIVRMVSAGERLEFDGGHHQLPLPGGEGKALRSAAPPVHVPIYVASLGPANLRLTGALADGWIGNSFFCETAEVFTDAIVAGAASVGRSLQDIELTVSVSCEFTDDIEAAGRCHARATRSPSGRWAPERRTSTTRPSSVRGSPPRWPRCKASGRPVIVTPLGGPCPPRSGSAPI